MRIRTQIFSPDQSDPKLQRRLFIADQICLFLALQIALINLLWRAFPSVDKSLPAGLLHMSASNAGAALCAVLALFLAEAARGKRIRWLSRMFAVMTTLVAAAPVLARMVGTPNEVGRFGAGNSLTAGRGLLPATALVFVLLGIVILFVQDGKSVTGHIADGLTAGVCLLMLVLLLDFLFDLAHVPGSSKVGLPPLATLGCAMLVTSATVIRRMEHGTFAIFLGYGIGSRFARFLAPILLIMPFWREVMRARMMNSGLIP